MPFLIKLPQDKQSSVAALAGFHGQNWRDLVLADLTHDGQLEVASRHNSEGVVYDLYGRRLQCIAAQDRFRSDTLFVIAVQRGPAVGNRLPKDTTHVPGPWRLFSHTASRNNLFPASEHIDSWIRQATPKSLSGSVSVGSGVLAVALSKAASIGVAHARSTASKEEAGRNPPRTSHAASLPTTDSTSTSSAVESTSANPSQDSDVYQATDTEPLTASASATSASVAPSSQHIYLRSALASRAPEAIREFLSTADPLSALASRRSEIASLIEQQQHLFAHLPPDDEVRSVVELADAIVGRLASIHSDPIALLTVDPGHLRRVPDLGRTSRVLEALGNPLWASAPDWLLPVDFKEKVLKDDSIAAEFEEVVEWLSSEFGPGDGTVTFDALLPGDDSCASMLERFQNAWERSEATRRRSLRIASLPVDSRPSELSDVELTQALERIETLRLRFHADAVNEIAGQVGNVAFAEWLKFTSTVVSMSAPDQLVRHITSVQALQALSAFVEASAPAGIDVTGDSTSQQRDVVTRDPLPVHWFLRFTHPATTDQAKIRASTVAVVLPDSTSELGMIRIAVRLVVLAATVPRGIDGLTVFVRVPHVRTMPVQVITESLAVIDDPRDSSRRCARVTVPCAVWDTAENGNTFFDFSLPIPGYSGPLRDLLKSGAQLTVSIELDAPGQELSSNLTFARFMDGVPTVVVPEEDRTAPETMKASPLGVQPGYAALDHYVRDASKSFLVSAPRRFGKTTLLAYLESVAGGNPATSVVRVTLNRNDSPARGMDTVLRDLSDGLQQKYGVKLSFPIKDGLLDRKTFLETRQFLARRGITSLLLMIDEAQSLVPRSDGGRWGTHLKNLIETDLAVQTPELARVCVVMAGTPQLSRRLGPNCTAFMNVMAERTSFSESELARFTLRFSNDRIDSSSQARERLANKANNLFTLKKLLREVINIAHSDGRAFFLSSDVELGSERLIEQDREGTIGLWEYVAAELSHTDHWDPIDAYPVALALALVDSVNGSLSDRRQAVTHWLDEQLSANGVQATVSEDRVRDAMQELDRLGITTSDGAFRRPLLKQLLSKRAASRPFQNDLDQIALARLATDVIAWDARLDARARGGQAEVYLLDDEHAPQAWRVCSVEHESERRRFVRTCAAIKVLRDVRTRLEGDRHLPRVRKAGFDIDDPQRGIIIYDWIEGEAFDCQWASANIAARVHVATQIASALDALRARGVIHRDVHPRNVIVDGTMNAVLVDFGMACLSDRAAESRVSDHDFLAPEALGGGVTSFPADIYALGRLLRGATGMDYAAGSTMDRAVSLLTHPDFRERPTAAQAVVLLRSLATEQPFLASLEQARRDVEEILERALEEMEWLYDVLAPQAEALAFRRANLQQWSVVSAMQAAACLSGVFERWVQRAETPVARALADLPWKPTGPSLAALRQVTLEAGVLHSWNRDDVNSVGQLRIANAHPSTRERALQRAHLFDRTRKPLDVYASSIRSVSELLDAAIGSGGIVESVAMIYIHGQIPPR